MCLVGIWRPIPRSERSIQMKVARKIHSADQQNKNIDRLYEILPPEAQLERSTQQPAS